MGNWIPNDPTSFVSQLLRISSAYTPPPPEGFVSPMGCVVEANVTMNAYAAAAQNGKVEELHQLLLDLAAAANTLDSGGFSITSTFLRVTVQL